MYSQDKIVLFYLHLNARAFSPSWKMPGPTRNTIECIIFNVIVELMFLFQSIYINMRDMRLPINTHMNYTTRDKVNHETFFLSRVNEIWKKLNLLRCKYTACRSKIAHVYSLVIKLKFPIKYHVMCILRFKLVSAFVFCVTNYESQIVCVLFTCGTCRRNNCNSTWTTRYMI